MLWNCPQVYHYLEILKEGKRMLNFGGAMTVVESLDRSDSLKYSYLVEELGMTLKKNKPRWFYTMRSNATFLNNLNIQKYLNLH